MEKINQNKEFLQSAQWRKFQDAVGRKTHLIENEDFIVSLIEHTLPMVGKYLYCPRGPVLNVKRQTSKVKSYFSELIELAQKNNAGWIRIEPENEEMLEIIRNNVEMDGNKLKVVKAPHDMQPKETFVIDISKSEEQLLAEMKPKTRYNINLAQKKGVEIYACDKNQMDCILVQTEFLKLTKQMAERQGITAHPEQYYRKMLETFPSEMLKIYAAKYENKIISTNLVLFFEQTATYLHGASGNEHRNLMAPYFLQWQAILDAQKKGCTKYDFGGVRIVTSNQQSVTSKNTWEGITTFKLGFSPSTKPVVFPGTYDIIINPRKYGVYRGLQRAKALLYKIRK